jgi:hypothetical protein
LAGGCGILLDGEIAILGDCRCGAARTGRAELISRSTRPSGCCRGEG